MAVNRTPVLKRCRSLGLEPAYMGIDKKSNRAVQRSNRKISEYGLQLREKQKAKFIYGMLEKQFKNTFSRAAKMKGVTGENLLSLLELRLDNVVFRMGLGKTRKDARQVVGHKFILVNGKRVNIPSYTVKVGDVIEVREQSKNMDRFKNVMEYTGRNIVPEWLSVDKDNLKATVVSVPTREQIDVPINETLIVELYSK